MPGRKVPAIRPDGTVDSEGAAQVLGMARATFFRYRREPDFPHPVQVGRGGKETLYRISDLIAWRDRRMSGAGQTGTAPSDTTEKER
jgi:predicted DNA-binding transcriptional regulator AlpA